MSKYIRASDRTPLEGFPIARQFSSRTEIENYLTPKKVVCLLCGRSYQMLCTHISRSHGVSTYEYKRRFNIPQTYALSSSEVVVKQRWSQKQFYDNNPDRVGFLNLARQDAVQARAKNSTYIDCDLIKRERVDALQRGRGIRGVPHLSKLIKKAETEW